MDGGISRLQRLGHDGRINDIRLPFDGTIGSVFTNAGEKGALLSLTGWLTPARIYSVELIHRRGLKLNGEAPTWISAYGSYGLSAYTPAFAGRSLALIDAGAIVG